MSQLRHTHLGSILPRLSLAVASVDTRPARGRVREIRGVIVHASLPQARVGELCHLRDPVTGRQIPAEVIGFEDERAVLSPIGDLEGMSARAEVIPTGHALRVPVSDALLGRVIDPMGRPLDAKTAMIATAETYPVQADPPHALQRDIIEHPLRLGVRAIDGLMTVARGQRVGIFGEPGAGKSSLLASIVAGTEADVIVVGLIGERGREVREFVDVQLSAQAKMKAVTVVATSDRPAIERVKAAYVATTVAEYFRDRGRNVLLLMDSVTRFARAQREIGLAAGEPPTRRGFPPSFFAALPRLLERAGPGRGGSITALYTILTEGDGGLDPVAEETKSILDGHIVLSGELAQRNHFPAIDVLKSRSRLMNAVVDKNHRDLAGTIRESMAAYRDIELLLRVGEYKAGSDARADAAVAQHDAIEAFLRQPSDEVCDIQATIRRMREIIG
jgi:ATP synthase in type III secretion protein N